MVLTITTLHTHKKKNKKIEIYEIQILTKKTLTQNPLEETSITKQPLNMERDYRFIFFPLHEKEEKNLVRDSMLSLKSIQLRQVSHRSCNSNNLTKGVQHTAMKFKQ